jgi:hypothetical protein
MKTHASVPLAILLALLSVLSYAQAAVPFVNLPLVPDATAPGGPQFTLTVNGTGFVSGSVVKWNGNALATQFVSGSQLTATVPAVDIATASTASVTVVNPAPGGGTSSVAFFAVTPNIKNSVAFAVTSSPADVDFAVAVGDFNGDGKLDLAVGGDITVSILLGDGTGNFTQGSTSPVGNDAQSVVVGDFNGDGKLDLAVTNYWVNWVAILLGDGTGNFTPFSNPGVGSFSTSVAVGDFNGDGKLDLAVLNQGDATVSILLGDGTGNFTLASSPGVSEGPTQVAVGDFNGDGNLDLAIGGNPVSILLGDGKGNFTTESSTPVNGGLAAVGDFNGDGNLDLAVFGGGTVSILLGDGKGDFTMASPTAVDGGSAAMGDFNGDGNLDLAFVNWGGTVSILLGDGKGNLSPASSIATVCCSASVAVGDFNGDGLLDVVIPNYTAGKVSILLAAQPFPVVRLSPASLTFGPQLFGSSSAPQPVTLTNTGGAPLDITKGMMNANFSQTNNCPRQLLPGRTCTVNVVFTPRNVNTITGTLTITDNAPNSPQTMPLSGVGFAVTLLPSSLDFGSQTVGTTSQAQTVTLTNYAPAALTIGKIQTNPNFAQTNNCGTSVPAGGSCTISVTFTPMRKGKFAVQLLVYDNGGASPQFVSVSGIGT